MGNIYIQILMVLSLDELNAQTNRVLGRLNNQTNRVIGRTNNTIANGFNSVFNRDTGMEFARGLSIGFGGAGNVLGKISDGVSRVFDAPIVGNFLKETAPELYLANKALKGVATGASGLSNVVNPDNYRGQDGSKLAGNILEKSVKTVVDTERDAGGFKYR
jgi:hypothetical protein